MEKIIKDLKGKNIEFKNNVLLVKDNISQTGILQIQSVTVANQKTYFYELNSYTLKTIMYGDNKSKTNFSFDIEITLEKYKQETEVFRIEKVANDLQQAIQYLNNIKTYAENNNLNSWNDIENNIKKK